MGRYRLYQDMKKYVENWGGYDKINLSTFKRQEIIVEESTYEKETNFSPCFECVYGFRYVTWNGQFCKGRYYTGRDN